MERLVFAFAVLLVALAGFAAATGHGDVLELIDHAPAHETVAVFAR